ncbi:MAG: formimidoylglutamate deiminase [Acidobacteria bacterium]|nr:formimidoylglutamate deiminase [Acidobacteriota bacterium]
MASAINNITWVPDLLFVNGRFEPGMALACDSAGRIISTFDISPLRELLGREPRGDETLNVREPESRVAFKTRFVRLHGRALLPGMVNAHSHAFQRVIRGRTEYRAEAGQDSFWTWREMMYSAAERLTPEDIYDASRMAFTEMLLGGITAVGEFHYLHRTPEGAEYSEPNLLAKQVVRAARDAGLRIALLRVAYARSGFNLPPNERQRRFIETDAETYLRHAETLRSELAKEASEVNASEALGDLRGAWVGVAPHSVRAVPLEYLRAVRDFARERELPLHMHVAEQPAEVSACLAETGRTPVALLADCGLLDSRFTAVHAIHISAAEIGSLRDAGAIVCACPTTERNLGDGIVPADALFREGVRVALGTDSHAQIDLPEEARALEYHLRLQRLERNVLAPRAAASDERGHRMSALAARLFECATTHGARSIGAACGELEAGRPADFFTVALDDPSVAGASAEDLLPAIIFSLTRSGVREVAVGGRLVVEDGRHRAQGETVERFAALQRKLWG